MRGHVERCAYNGLEENILALYIFSKAKITEFTLLALEKNVGWFEITMDDVVTIEILDAFHDLLQE